MLNAKSFIELAQTAQSSKVNLRLLDKEKQYHLRLKRLVEIFSQTSFIPRARFPLNVQEGYKMRLKLKTINQTQRLLATIRLVWNISATDLK
jgi:hypothetical protein